MEARLPSGRNVLVRGVDGGNAHDDDAGQLRDVRFRGVDFEALTATLHEVGALVKGTLQALTPTEAVVEIGLGISAKTGQLLVLFGEAAADASMKIVLTWRFDPRGDGDDEA